MIRAGAISVFCLAVTAAIGTTMLAASPISGARAGESRQDDKTFPPVLGWNKDTDRPAPADFGYGPGVARPKHKATGPRSSAAALATASVPSGTATAAVGGVFGAAISWPLIPIHVVLLPDGRMLSYGTDATGKQGAQFIYDVWDPTLGNDTTSHLVLPNTTTTDIFCSAQSLMWTNGEVLITGGDKTISRVRNYSNNQTNIFTPAANSLTAASPMSYPRWYPSLIALPSGEMLVLGGRQDPTRTATSIAPYPEVFNNSTGWRVLSGADGSASFASLTGGWFYPRAFLAPDGSIFIVGTDGRTFSLTTAGIGAVVPLAPRLTYGSVQLPTVMYAPGKILSVRSGSIVYTVDINGPVPVVAKTGPISQNRYWGSAAVMADGRVVVSGGSSSANALTGTAFNAEIWNPTTGSWTLGAAATKPRLYHSNALLLPDATVWTGGGGAPGPVNNLNAEIFYPPYLYLNDGSGLPAPRPTILAASNFLLAGQTGTATVGPSDTITRVTFVRSGSATHSTNSDQRFLDLPFTQTLDQVAFTLPTNTNILLPGYYMLFAFNATGTPSVASMVFVSG